MRSLCNPSCHFLSSLKPVSKLVMHERDVKHCDQRLDLEVSMRVHGQLIVEYDLLS